MSKVANMLNMLQILKDKNIHSISSLAERLEVSERMIIHIPPLILTAKLSIERPIAINRMVIKLIVQKLFCKDRK